MRKRLAATFVGLLSVMLIAGVAVAADSSGSDTATGKGKVWAKGEGVAALDGAGKVKLTIDGDVFIEDRAGDATVVIRTYADADSNDLLDAENLDPATTYDLEDFRGVVKVKGSDFRIEAEGTMKLKGKGHGTVTVDGKGRWHTWRNCGRWNGSTATYGVAAAEAS